MYRKLTKNIHKKHEFNLNIEYQLEEKTLSLGPPREEERGGGGGGPFSRVPKKILLVFSCSLKVFFRFLCFPVS